MIFLNSATISLLGIALEDSLSIDFNNPFFRIIALFASCYLVYSLLKLFLNLFSSK